MNGELPSYPEYKDSGAQWFGKVPAHWNLPRLGSVLHERGEQNANGSIDHVLSLLRDVGVIPYEDKGNIGNKKSEDITRYKIVRPGDIVLNSMNVIIGSVGLSKYEGCLSPVYYVLRTKQSDDLAKYYATVFQMKSFQQSLVRLGNGILAHRLRIPMELLKAEPIPQPPPEEQQAIVRYLDHIDRRIRRYIRARRRLIALLGEQKQAIIHQAVTRGLDPSVPLKPSGVEWLGDVPAHWEVVRIKSLLREVDERTTTGQETLLAMRMNHGLVPYHKHFSRPAQASTLVGYKIVRPGQVAMNRLQANNGLVFASGTTGLISPDYAVFKSIAGVDLEFLTTLFRSSRTKAKFRAEAKGLGTGTSGFLRLYTDRFGMIPIALPPRNEQTQIMLELDRMLEGANGSIARIEKEIDLIREYRTRLIADVVTGKVDVRAAAANLPVEFDEPGDTLDEGEDAEPDAGEEEEGEGEGKEE